MSIITDFSQELDGGNVFSEALPEHTVEALDHYFMKGWEPGGFLTAMITEDYKLALKSADQANRQRFWHVASWLVTHAPKDSTGSEEIMNNWLDDKDGIRSAYVVEAEKNYEWRILSGDVQEW